ncbi:DNA mismatch repair endonuclease MutL [Thermogemmatispora carboxidivorans]|uniref:DNA mismatch repair endonuclease MutL n=1 Tax=Thermogemmatispora carboxidivorans TaxID=1382306 RepID=UPI0009DEBE85|nr:DNA mismatch repair endonuclease MutL [Thermogemmatispora carboxidivorans]
MSLPDPSMSDLTQPTPSAPKSLPPRLPIRQLAAEVAERIAAGEVIERPVSVVKELVENALDAGAHEIRVEIRDGGLRLIRVSDNGQGIPEEDLERACARHSTSKIGRVEDLEQLHTLGFRGEALASIAAVSELTLLSRPIESEESGLEEPAAWITVRGGELVQRGHRARPHGTTVTVRELFYNVPARLKFMRSARSEAGQILQLLYRYAAGYPAVRFNLSVEEQPLLQTSGSGELATALAELYRLPLAELLIPVEVEDEPGIRIFGYVGNRVLAQPNRQHVMLFINGRPVQARALQEALEAGYRPLLAKGRHPLLVLHLQLPASEVDANVHPAKTEVRLKRERELATLLTQSVRAVLERSPVLPAESTWPGPASVYQPRLPGPRRRGLRVLEESERYGGRSGLPTPAEVLAALRPLAQLQQAVILAEAPDGSLYLIDQHRAHERILYEHLRSRAAGAGSEGAENLAAHLLLEPVVLELKGWQAELLEQRLPILASLGLDCEHFGGRSFLVRSVPEGIGDSEQLVAHLRELVEIALEESGDWKDRLLIGLACRSALRRGRTLSQGEQQDLLLRLAQTSAPAVCPHGSPVLLHYSRAFLSEKFEW